MTAAVAVGSVLVRRPWSVRFHCAASIRSTTCVSTSCRGLAARSGDLAARQGSAWPLAHMPVESRREGLHDGSRRSRRRWRLRIRSPRLRLMVLDYSYDKRWPQRRHLSQSFWPSDWQHRIRRRGPDPMRRWPFPRPWRTITAEATAFASAGGRGLSIKPSIMMAGPI